MKTLVTGATGFLGSILVRQLLQQGTDVRILTRKTSKMDLLGDVASSLDCVVGDITDLDTLKTAMQGTECVYHCAALVEVIAKNKKLVARMLQVNVDGTANIINAALASGVERIVHTSSIAALGRSEHTAQIDETTPWQHSRKNSHYATSKHRAELQVHRGIAEGLDAVIVNPSVVFGPGRPGENTMRIFELVRKGWRLGVPGGGVNVVDVEDVAAGHILAMNRGRTGERYVLGGENLLWETIFAELAKAAGARVSGRRIPPALALSLAAACEVGAFLTGTNPVIDRTTVRALFDFWHVSSAKATKELGYSYRPFAETARRMAAMCS